MKKRRKRLLIAAGLAAVVLGGVAVAGKVGNQEVQIPQVAVVEAQLGDVKQTVDAAGTVVSDEEKTYFSPVNAAIKTMDLKAGDSVKAGTRLVAFDLDNLEQDNQKASLNVKAGKMDYKNAVNKSDKAVKKQSDAKAHVAELERKVAEQKNYVASLKSRLSAVSAQAQRDAQAYAAAQAQREAQEARQQADAAREAQEAKLMEIQREYSAALATYNTQTLPEYQKELGILSARASQALSDYNQADMAYQMAFVQWQTDPSEENEQILTEAEQARSQAEIARMEAEQNYEAKKADPPQMPVMADYTAQADVPDFVTDGAEADDGFSSEAGMSENVSTGSASGSYVAPDTSGIENALEQASSDLAELQSELASEKAVAEADAMEMTKEEKEKMKITNNLTELDAKTAEELVEEGKKGIIADFNGVISRVAVTEGASVSQGMELLTLQNTDEVNVEVNISKYDYDKIQEGQKAEITLAGKNYRGTVTKISHLAVQNEKGTPVLSATVRIEDPDPDIFLGVDAKVKIHAKEVNGVVTLPVEVVNIGKDGSFCYVLENGVITRRNISTGLSSVDYIEVTEGIEAGDQVISDLGTLQEGMPAQAEESAETGDDV